MLVPDRDAFGQLGSSGQPVPVVREVLADLLTPLGAYWRLAHDEPVSFLLESVTGGEQISRYSLIGVRPRRVVRTKGQTVQVRDGAGPWTTRDLEPGEDPLAVLKAEMPVRPVAVEGLPPFVGGAVGALGYDLVRFFERLPDANPDDLDFPDLAMMLTDAVVVFDHAKNLIKVVVLADPTEEGYDRAEAEIDRLTQRLTGELPTLPSGRYPAHPVTSNQSQSEYEGAVRTMKEYIAAGDGIQMVPSLRLATPVDAHPLTVYRCLRSLNPSPYMFLLRFEEFDVVGASPEILVSLKGTEARVRPIAGTRWRGKDQSEDMRLEMELLADEKERAEHIMLVDLGRNDLGRVCRTGTVRVEELMVVERYSHVMHIVSDVRGELAPGLDALDLVRATFPAGTVSGAPKIRAMEIIDEVEPTRRGLYAGAVGYLSAQGDFDAAIAIRTILIRAGTAYVQVGAGIVFDSDPAREYEECRNKAMAALRAIELAQAGL